VDSGTNASTSSRRRVHTGPRAASGMILTVWQASFSALLQRSGLNERTADAIAPLLIAAIKGALVISRTQESLLPFDSVSGASRRPSHSSREPDAYLLT